MNNSGKAIKKSIEVDYCVNKGAMSLRRWCKSIGVNFDDKFEVTKNPPIYAEHIVVKTLEGHSYKLPMDYVVIRGSNDDFYPHEPELFKANYTISKKSELPDFLVRIVSEKKELSEKINKLNAFIQSKKIRELDIEQSALLFAQRKAMKEYLDILEQRIALIVDN